MKVEIWSDIMCPFCYIGKRNFENALAKFTDKESVEVEWKSFQLDPSIPEVAQENQIDYLVKRKGMAREQVETMLGQVTEMAQQVGLEYHLDQAVMVNSEKAHCLIQFAKTKNLSDAMEERLFRAYFTEGKNVADTETLVQLGTDIGLDKDELLTALADDTYRHEMRQDIQEAQNLGIQGVPFFVFDRKYGVSGAQPEDAFLETLTTAFADWRKSNPEPLITTTGASCDTSGNCD